MIRFLFFPTAFAFQGRDVRPLDLFSNGFMFCALGTWAMVAVAGATVIGGAISYAGAKKNADATKGATDANISASAAADQKNFERWLMTRGQGLDGQPVNTKLPLWMTSTAFGAAPNVGSTGFAANPSTPAANTAGSPHMLPVNTGATTMGYSNPAN